jgi:hypothetical protein
MSGTSHATAHLSAVLAFLSSPPTAPGVDALTSTRDPLRDNPSDPVANSQYGYGLVNARSALDAIHPLSDAGRTPMATTSGR